MNVLVALIRNSPGSFEQCLNSVLIVAISFVYDFHQLSRFFIPRVVRFLNRKSIFGDILEYFDSSRRRPGRKIDRVANRLSNAQNDRQKICYHYIEVATLDRNHTDRLNVFGMFFEC